MSMKKNPLSENAQQVAKSRYFSEQEDWESCTFRVANTISSVENGKSKMYRDIFHEMIYDRLFIPGGRILRNSGKPKGSLLNCFVVPIGDSIEEIGTCIKHSLILWSEGGGVGINFSTIRPEGDLIKGKGGTSSGLVSFINVLNEVAQTVESGGSRRAAAIGIVSVEHPEVLDFINAKLKHDQLNSFNISIGINNNFLDAVEEDLLWEFKFAQKTYGKLPAREIWKSIVDNMIKSAEPGIINMDNLIVNNSWYFAPIVATNPCGEVPLQNYGCCCLGSLVLPSFITGTVNTNWKLLETTIKNAVRFLDNVLDCNKYPLQEVDISSHNTRRIGLGVMGLAEYLFAKGLKYGSEKGNNEIERLFKFIRDCSYSSSIELALEKGAFPKFDNRLYPKSPFIQKLPAPIRIDIKDKGIRNCTIMAAAPTGTISLIADCSSGIEPLFSKGYLRKDRVSERIYIHPRYEEILLKESDEDFDWFVDSYDLKPAEHFEVQNVCQKYIDGSVSKTINLPHNTSSDDLSRLLLEYARDLKGTTVYRDGCRDGQIQTQITKEQALQYLKGKNNISKNLTSNDVKCAIGKCDL